MTLPCHILRGTAIAFLAFASYSSFCADDLTIKDSFRRIIRGTTVQLTEPIVNYCRAQAPESAVSLEAGYSNYLARTDEATESWIQTRSANDLTKPIPPEAEKEVSQKMAETSEQMLAAVRKRNAREYCAWLADNLRSYTLEAAQKSMLRGQAMIDVAREKLRR